MRPLLEVHGLRSGYAMGEVLHGVALHVNPGEIVALIGPNGAGKTTTLKTVMGQIRPLAGVVQVDGSEVTHLPTSEIVRRGVVLVPEGRRVFPELTVEENLRMGAYKESSRKVVAERLDEIYELFPVLRAKKRQLAGELSGGQQQMLAIGRGLMAGPRLLLLDEPSMGLAPKLVLELFHMVRELHARGTTVLLVEQNARAALNISHRAYVLENGSIVLEGISRDLLSSGDVKQRYLGSVATR